MKKTKYIFCLLLISLTLQAQKFTDPAIFLDRVSAAKSVDVADSISSRFEVLKPINYHPSVYSTRQQTRINYNGQIQKLVGTSWIPDPNYISENTANKGAANGYVPLVSGKIPNQYLTPIPLGYTYVCSSLECMLGLDTAKVGDICKRTDSTKVYILQKLTPSNYGHWILLNTSIDNPVTSVNGQSGTVVLTASDVGAIHTGGETDPIFIADSSLYNSKALTNAQLAHKLSSECDPVYISDSSKYFRKVNISKNVNLGTSDADVPSQKAIKTYVDNHSSTIDTTTKIATKNDLTFKEPKISKSTGYLYWNGIAWVWRNDTYLPTSTWNSSVASKITSADTVKWNLNGSTDTNTYVTIGSQIWMKYNLRVNKYNDGSSIPKVTNNAAWAALTTPAYCWYNNDSATNYPIYGALYNWYAVNTGKLCPIGTHVPSNTENNTLITFLGGSSVAGGHLKSIGTTYWTSPNTGADNSSGFSGLPGGVRNDADAGAFENKNTEAIFQSTTQMYSGVNYALGLFYNNATGLISGGDEKAGFSVRCIKNNYETDPIYSSSAASKYTGADSTKWNAKLALSDTFGGSGNNKVVTPSYVASHGLTLPIIGNNQTNAIKLSTNSSHNDVGLLDIYNTSAGYGSSIYNASTGIGSYIGNNSTGAGSIITNASTGTGSFINNASTGIGISIYNASTGYGSSITNASTGTGSQIDNTSTGYGSYIDNISTGYGIYMTNTSNGIGSYIYNTSTGYGIYMNNTSTGIPFNITDGSTNRTIFNPSVVDGASAVGYTFDTKNALSTSGAKLMSVKNSGTEKFYIDKDGEAYANGVHLTSGGGGSLTSITAGNGLTGGTITTSGTISVDTLTTGSGTHLKTRSQIIADTTILHNEIFARLKNTDTLGYVHLVTPKKADSLFIRKSAIITTTTFYVDTNRTNIYTQNGSPQYPYKRISTAITAGNALAVPFSLEIAAGTYSDATVATIAYPCVIHANNSTYTVGSGAGSLTLSNKFSIYGLKLIGNLVQSNTSQAIFCALQNTEIYGNLTVSGSLSTLQSRVFGNGVANSLITVNSTSMATFSNTILGAQSANAYARIVNSGYLLLLESELFANDNSNYALTSSAVGSTITLSTAIITNAGTGGGVNCDNSATNLGTQNEIVNTEVFINGATNGITCGTAYSYLDIYKIFNTATGLAVVATGSNLLNSYAGGLNVLNNLTTPQIYGNTAQATNLSISGNSATASGTNIAGGEVNLYATPGTGTGVSGFHLFTGTTLTTGSTLQTSTEKVTIFGNGNVGIGNTNPAGKLQVNANASTPAILIAGTAYINQNTDATNGVGFYLTYNGSGNRQWVIADSYTGVGIRFFNNNMDAVTSYGGARADLQLGTETNGAHINAAVSNTQFSVSNLNGTASKIVTEIKGAAAQSGNYLNISRSGGTGDILSILSSGYVGIGTTTPTNILSLGGQSARTIWMERNTTANTAGNSITSQSGGATVAATDKDAGNNIIALGLSTGTGKASVRLQGLSRAASTGTADNTLEDRLIIPSVKNLTNTNAIGLFDVSLPTLAMAGGIVDYTIIASDGTDMHSITGRVIYDVVNKGGVYTSQLTPTLNTVATSNVGGTNVPVFTIVTGTNKFTVTVTDTDSLTPTTLQIRYTIHNNSGSTITQL